MNRIPHGAMLLLGVTCLIALVPLWASGLPAGTDILLQELDFRDLLVRSISDASLPRWNPFLLGGTPHLAAGLGGPLHPLNLLLIPFSPEWAIKLALLGHLLIAAFSAYLLAHRFSGSAPGALAAGASYALGGFFFFHFEAGHLSLIGSFALIPLPIWCLDRLLDKPSAGHTVAATLSVALLVFSGHPQLVAFGLLALFFFAIFRVVEAWTSRAWKKQIGALLFTAFGAAMLSALQWLPALEFASRSGRRLTEDPAFVAGASLQAKTLELLLTPDSVQGKWEVGAFLGLLGLVFVICAFFAALRPSNTTKIDSVEPGVRRRKAIGLFILLLVSILLSIDFVYRGLCGVIPLLSLFRIPGRFLALASLWAVPLIAFGVSWLDRRKLLLSTMVIVALVTTSSLFFGGGLKVLWSMPVILPTISLLVGIAIFGRLGATRLRWLLVIAMLAELSLFAARRIELRSDPTPLASNLVDAAKSTSSTFGGRILIMPPLALNSAVRAGLPSLGGYVPASTERYRRYFSLAVGDRINRQRIRFFTQRLSKGLIGLSLNQILAPAKMTVPESVNRVALSGPAALFSLSAPLGRARIVRRTTVAKNWQDAISMAAQAEVDLRHVAVLEAPLPEKAPGRGEAGEERIAWQSDSLDRLSLDVDLVRPGLVVLADSYDPGWKALSNGQPTQVVPVNGVLMGVFLDRGQHQLRLVYRPWSVQWGLWISLLSAVMVLVVGFGNVLRVRKKG